MAMVGDRLENTVKLAGGFDFSRTQLGPREAFVFSRIDGRLSVGSLIELSAMGRDEALAVIQSLLDKGAIEMDGAGEGRPGAQAEKREEPQAVAAETKIMVPALGLSAEGRDRIHSFYMLMADMNHYQLLGIGQDSSAREIKQGYLKLSREFHPDGQFRKALGVDKVKLEEIFKKVNEAYRMLSKAISRKEYDRSIASPVRSRVEREIRKIENRTAGEGTGSWPVHPGAVADLKAVEEVAATGESRQAVDQMADTGREAERLYAGAVEAGENGNMEKSAEKIIRALSLDPGNEKYRRMLEGLQKELDRFEKGEFLDKALLLEKSGDLASALESAERALGLSPDDAVILVACARLKYNMGEDLAGAKDLALKAVERKPDDAGARLLLGRIFRSKGMVRNAARELEKASALDTAGETGAAARAALQEIEREGK
jgi:curved DNA-binding protein CbpA